MDQKYSIYETEHIKNPNWQEADKLAIYKGSQQVEPGSNWNKSSCMVVRAGPELRIGQISSLSP